jgi:hypothetical protein
MAKKITGKIVIIKNRHFKTVGGNSLYKKYDCMIRIIIITIVIIVIIINEKN